MDVLVTGGAGFIGAHVCRALRGESRVGRIVVVDDLSTGLASNLGGIDEVDLVNGTILDGALVTSLLDEVDAVVHLAAVPAVARSIRNPRASHDVNATGTVIVLDAARRHGRHVVVASSSSVYGRGIKLPTPEHHPTRPASPYAASKLATESYALAFARSFDIPVLALRLFNVYGPLQRSDHAYAAVIPAFASAALRDEPVTVHGDGSQTRDFTYVGDVAAVVVDALVRSVAQDEPVNLAFGTRVSVLSIVEEMEELLGRPLARVHGPPRTGDVHDSQGDPTRLRGLFPGAVPTGLREGLSSTLEWTRSLVAADAAAAGERAPAVSA